MAELLKKGTKGDALKMVHTALAGSGYDVGPIDGVFGPNVQAAVKALQEKHGLPADGVVGPRTWRAITSL